jgi:NADPH:quinone reductase
MFRGAGLCRWVVSQITPEGSMQFCDVAQPCISADECLVRVEGAETNFLDKLMMRSLYQGRPQPPFTSGIEVVGVVVERRLCGIRSYPALGVGQDSSDNACPGSNCSSSSVFDGVSSLTRPASLEAGETVLVHAGTGA